jgi:opacity protein-like surface antigen
LRKLLYLSLLTLLCALPAAAQTTAGDDRRPEFFVGYSNLQAEGLPERNTTTGSFSDDLFGERTGLHGINVEATGYLTPRFGLTGDFSYHARDRDFTPAGGGEGDIDTRVIQFMGGPQVRFPNQTRATPFLRALFGVANTRFNVSSSTQTAGGGNVTSTFSTNATDFAMALGGGLDVRVGERVALRVFQLDYNPVFLRERSISVLGGAGAIQPTRLESNRQDNIRLGFGVTFK